MHDCTDTRNRFNPENRFIGDIEDGLRYPFACYTKEESDERYAAKATEAGLATTQASLAELSTVVEGKASKAELTELSNTVDSKASATDLSSLADTVSTKADESECVDIRARLDALEYQPIKINSLTGNPTVCELGSSNTIALAWNLNKAASQQNINGNAVTGNSTQIAGVTAATTYTLNVTDGQTSASKAVSVEFANQIYYGVDDDLSAVTELSKVLSNDKTRTITVDAGVDEYIIYAIPVRLGTVAFYVSGFEGGFEDPEEQLLTNESGYQEKYNVYRSTHKNLGQTTVDIREE